MNFARRQSITILTMQLHCNHKQQPLGVAVFGSFSLRCWNGCYLILGKQSPFTKQWIHFDRLSVYKMLVNYITKLNSNTFSGNDCHSCYITDVPNLVFTVYEKYVTQIIPEKLLSLRVQILENDNIQQQCCQDVLHFYLTCFDNTFK